jgi:glycosyltransferase involved in cell wall biosynthesis
MHVCLICVEIFAWEKYGGFGRATRIIGRELVNRGFKVSAIVPRRQNQAKIEYLDGIRVLGFDITNIREMIKVFKECDADIYHSQEPSFGTYIAQKYQPDKKHIVTFRDTRFLSDWFTEFRLPSLNKLQVLFNMLYEDNFLGKRAVKNADRCFVAAKFLIERSKNKYNLSTKPEFLPTPVPIPKNVKKDPNPTVCYVSRLDRRKRPELMIELAKNFPNVHFIIAGISRDKKFDLYLRNLLKECHNVDLPGFINQFESKKISDIYSRSWIQLNTSARECLPNSFIEGCAHKCALLSSVDPDGFSSKFGFYATNDEFSEGLEFLLLNDNWKDLGEKGYNYVIENFSLENSIDKHMDIYLRVHK